MISAPLTCVAAPSRRRCGLLITARASRRVSSASPPSSTLHLPPERSGKRTKPDRSSTDMRVAHAVQGALFMATLGASEPAYNPQFVVLGTDGKVVQGADPSLYFRRSKTVLAHRQQDQPLRLPQDEQPKQVASVHLEARSVAEPTPSTVLSFEVMPQVPVELLPGRQAKDEVQLYKSEDEFSATTETAESSTILASSSFLSMDKSDGPAVHGSILFAELSCFFVAFIGYLVHSIPLWGSFSRGQKCCLAVAFSSAALFQLATLGWSLGAVSPELMLGLSSLITRMISLGMVPVTTTSFMGRAREVCQAANTHHSSSSSSRSSRRHHSRARSS